MSDATNTQGFKANTPATTTPPQGMATLNLLDVCEAVIKRAVKKGASQAECWADHGRAIEVSLEQNELKGASVNDQEAFGIRVFVGDRTGFAYVNRRDGAALDEAIDDALSIARASAGDPANDLVDPRPLRPIGGLHDPRIAALGIDDVVALGRRLLESARRDKRVSIDSGSVTASFGGDAIATTRGIRAADDGTALTWGLFGMAIHKDEVGSFDHVTGVTRRVDGVDDAVAKSGREFAGRVVDLLGAKKGRSFSGPALFSPDAFTEIFIDTLLGAVDGDAVLKGKSRLKNKLGERIASPGLVVVEDGSLAGGFSSARYDREGLPHRRTVLVGDGILHSFLYDGKTAKRANTQSTGHALGSARSLPAIGTTNLRVSPGDRSDEQLLRDLKNGLLIGRFSGNVDEVSGDFSGVAKGSFLVKNGVKSAPVQETLISGNVFELLTRILARGSKLHSNVATECPYVLVDGVTVTAG